MNKKLAAALSGGAVLVVALSGCSSSKGTDPKLIAWAKTVCDAVPAQDAKIKAANEAISTAVSDTTSSPATIQKTDSKAFQDMSDAYKALASAISGAGAPPGVDEGAKRQQDVVTTLNSLSASYADLKKKVDALDTKDQAKFASGLQDIASQTTQLETQSKSGTAALNALEQGEVKDAIAEQASCKKVSTSTSSSTSSAASSPASTPASSATASAKSSTAG
ncbi:small secreted protein [Streptomyces shenzhenensis]|uniref:small secreted protein n=1 Tax=Streptomyces shenzhenensis TaxID=943815 RepID=UPI0028681B6C|nr:small secreted protein [Streptomyces shenzhenensis]